jgi:hypothetical protein
MSSGSFASPRNNGGKSRFEGVSFFGHVHAWVSRSKITLGAKRQPEQSGPIIKQWQKKDAAFI